MKKRYLVFIICMIMLNAVSACGVDTGTISESESQDITTETEMETDAEGAYEPSDDAFVRVRDYIPTIQVDLRYATTNNFTGQIIYTFDEAYLRYGTVLKLQQVAEVFHFHPSYINRVLTEQYGISFRQLLIRCRIQNAIPLLENTQLSAEEIAVAVGFYDGKHFAESFRKQYGRTPSQYR
jgi:AraC-like DNA-binding protein